jgi:Cupin domain
LECAHTEGSGGGRGRRGPYLQERTLTIQVGGKTQTASAGDFIRLPRGVAHSFQNTGDVDAKVLLVVAPAGLEMFFAEAFYPVEDRSAAVPPMTEEFMARVIAAATKVDVLVTRAEGHCSHPTLMNEARHLLAGERLHHARAHIVTTRCHPLAVGWAAGWSPSQTFEGMAGLSAVRRTLWDRRAAKTHQPV